MNESETPARPSASAGPDVRPDARVHVTDLGPALRIDLNMLGADLGPEPAGGRAAWSQAQNRRLCDFMAAELAKHGGGFDSLAEWTVAVNKHYDLQHMREVRTARWTGGFGSSITTLPWAHPASPKSVSIQTVAYVPKDPRSRLKLRAWQPACLYDCAFLGLAPAVVVELGEVNLIYLSGVVAWDRAIRPLAGDDPRAQVRLVLQKIREVFIEAGGSPADVVRLRPFTASPAVAQLVREECARLWTEPGHPAPVLMIAEESSFWGAPSLFTEIQVMGITGRDGLHVVQDECPLPGVTGAATRIRRTTTPLGMMFHAADLRAPAGTDPQKEAAAVAEQVAQVLREFELGAAAVCLAVGYVSSAPVRAQLEAALYGLVPPAALHLVHCPPMPELNGGTVKLELTAWRPR